LLDASARARFAGVLFTVPTILATCKGKTLGKSGVG
jgi:hypothetical protein